MVGNLIQGAMDCWTGDPRWCGCVERCLFKSYWKWTMETAQCASRACSWRWFWYSCTRTRLCAHVRACASLCAWHDVQDPSLDMYDGHPLFFGHSLLSVGSCVLSNCWHYSKFWAFAFMLMLAFALLFRWKHILRTCQCCLNPCLLAWCSDENKFIIV